MLPGYMTGIAQAGGIPLMLPLTSDREALDQLAYGLDGVLFTGGHDVSPSLYGEDVLPACAACSPERDAMEKILLDLVLERDMAAFGICRGIQFVNAALGGTLWQDLPSQRPSAVEHHMQPPYDRAAHRVGIAAGSPLHDLLGADELAVNSYHHQAVKDLAPHLEVMAVSEDGLVEAVRLPEAHFVWAVQWHPEFSWRTDEASRRLFAAFVRAAAETSDLV